MDNLLQYSLRLFRIANVVELALRWGITWFRFCSVLRVCCVGHQGVVGPRFSGTRGETRLVVLRARWGLLR